jgi:hypothetical protein
MEERGWLSRESKKAKIWRRGPVAERGMGELITLDEQDRHRYVIENGDSVQVNVTHEPDKTIIDVKSTSDTDAE